MHGSGPEQGVVARTRHTVLALLGECASKEALVGILESFLRMNGVQRALCHVRVRVAFPDFGEKLMDTVSPASSKLRHRAQSVKFFFFFFPM